MENYNYRKIEKKWQEVWDKEKPFNADDKSQKPKYYCLDMFPYTSADGLHVGHPKSYTATDIISRYKRACGFEVLHPIGWDSFGLPTENKAIKEKTHPKELTAKYIKKFREQIKSIGFSYDWSREFTTSDPKYYKWTQWLFLELYKAGLAYKKKAPVNWCEDCKTVLANEQVVGGKCERCKNKVVQKELSQWFFKINNYIEPLLQELDKLDWPDGLKSSQKNWIGKSDGALIKFEVIKENSKIKNEIQVFTTRPDTIGGATFLVLAPENQFIDIVKSELENINEVKKYIHKSENKTELERISSTKKPKDGVELKGIKAINPLTGDKVSMWVADYIISSYGTGVIMSVPAHDERDFAFAKKYKLPIKQVVVPHFRTSIGKDAVREDKKTIRRKTAFALLRDPKSGSYLCLDWEKYGWRSGIIGGLDKGEDYIQAATREIKEETGYQNIKFVKYIGGETHSHFYAAHKDVNRYAVGKSMLFELLGHEKENIKPEHTKDHKPVWVDEGNMSKWLNLPNFQYMWNVLVANSDCYVGDGKIVNSGKLNDLEWLKDNARIIKNIPGAESHTQYKLRDWLVSRQRYWGAPIPIVYCDKCGEVPIPEKDLPVLLPDDVDFQPTGESPLTKSKNFHIVRCPKCNSEAQRESDTMDTFVDSSWYFLRYTDPKNQNFAFEKEKIKKWLPIDIYIGGAEHAVLHLLYARFITKALKDLGHINIEEPFKKLVNQGLILADDGKKMSKSLGNVINPDKVIDEYGADTLRMYEMFMGPIEDAAPWDTRGIVGIKRFLDRVWRIDQYVKNESNIKEELNITINKVTTDIENLRFNTAISSMMEYINKAYKDGISKDSLRVFLILLSPFAPHITAELWQKMKFKNNVWEYPWPKILKDTKLNKVKVMIQVNGRVRGEIFVNTNTFEKDILRQANLHKNVQKFIAGKKIIKHIYIPSKIINIVI